MEYWKEVLEGLKTRFSVVTVRKNADIIVSDWIEPDTPLPKSSKVKAGGTTYLVSSYFDKDPKGNVVDKVSRLIEREAENLPDDL